LSGDGPRHVPRLCAARWPVGRLQYLDAHAHRARARARVEGLPIRARGARALSVADDVSGKAGNAATQQRLPCFVGLARHRGALSPAHSSSGGTLASARARVEYLTIRAWRHALTVAHDVPGEARNTSTQEGFPGLVRLARRRYALTAAGDGSRRTVAGAGARAQDLAVRAIGYASPVALGGAG
jgi:hypothetical protein